MNPLWPTLFAEAELKAGAAVYAKLDEFLDRLIEANQFVNLTRITDRTQAEIKHVADALTLLPHLPPGPHKLADVGTGGGVPGIILAIARPDVKVTLIDSTAKKIRALEEILQGFGLENVKLLNQRAESVQQTFDVITTRGVANLKQLVTWCLPIMKPTSRLLALKGPKAKEELAEAQTLLGHSKLKARTFPVTPVELEGHVIVKVNRMGDEHVRRR